MMHPPLPETTSARHEGSGADHWSDWADPDVVDDGDEGLWDNDAGWGDPGIPSDAEDLALASPDRRVHQVVPSNFDPAPELDVDDGPHRAALPLDRPPQGRIRHAASRWDDGVDIEEDFTGEFEAIENGEWNDADFSHLDDPTLLPAPRHVATEAPGRDQPAQTSRAGNGGAELHGGPTPVTRTPAASKSSMSSATTPATPRGTRTPTPSPSRNAKTLMPSKGTNVQRRLQRWLDGPPRGTAGQTANQKAGQTAVNQAGQTASRSGGLTAGTAQSTTRATATSRSTVTTRPTVTARSTVTSRSTHRRPVGGAVKPKRSKTVRSLTIGVVTLLTIFTLLAGYVVYQLVTIRKNEVVEGMVDLPGRPAPTLPPDTAPPDTIAPVPPTTVSLPVVIPGTGIPGDLVVSTIPATSIPGAVVPGVSTIPGEGTCEEEVLCAQAPVVSLSPQEQPRQGNLLVDPLPEDPIGGPNAYNILVVGTDSRKDVPAGERHRFGTVAGQRSDTIMVLRMSPDGKTAAILSIPRDTYVHISGKRKNDRINSAYAAGIPTLVATVRENFNIPIRHVMTVDFAGFEQIVGTIGGVNVCFDKPARDTVTGLDQPAGCHLLSAKQATGFVRSRRYEEFDGTNWSADGRGDLGRIARQQQFIRNVLQRAVDTGFTNPIKLNALIGDVKGAVTLDQTFDIGTVLETARTFSNFEPGALQTYVMPADHARINGKAVLRVRRAEASKLVARFGSRR